MATAHPLAQQLWRQLRDRPEADRRLVFNALQRRLDVGPTTAKQEQALQALGKWMELNRSDKAPSRRQYDSFREAQPCPRDWPSAELIRNAFGTWNGATAVAEGRPEANVLVRRKTSRGKKLEPEMIEKALRAWIRTIPADRPLFERQFLAWCRAESINADSEFERLPLTVNPINTAFGGWRDALAAVGALERAYEPPQRLLDAELAAMRIQKKLDLAKAPQSAGGGVFRSDELHAWIRWAQDQTTVATPISREAYGEVRRRALAVTKREGQVLRMPSPMTLTRRFSSWAAALKAAGLVKADAIGPHSTRAYTQAELLEAVSEARAATSTSLTELGYKRWRAEELKQRQRTNPSARIPSALALKNHLGGLDHDWEQVLRQAEDEQAGSRASESKANSSAGGANAQ